MPSAAIAVVGDEILTGKFADENGPFLIGRLRTLGCDVIRLATIRDDLDEIAAEVRRCSRAADLVVTSGGVGPTHDDMTLAGVARAFDLPLEERSELVDLLAHYGLPLNEATRRMARVPAGSILEPGQGLSFPVVQCHNVYILPGIPKLFRAKFEAIAPRFAGEEVSTARVFTNEPETDIALRLGAVAEAHPQVAIGSYPRFGEGPYRVIVTLESRSTVALGEAVAAVRAAISVVEPGAGG